LAVVDHRVGASPGNPCRVIDECGYVGSSRRTRRGRGADGDGGAEVEVVTPHMFAAEDVFRTSEMPFLFGRLAKANVRITAQEIIDRIEGDRVEIRGIWDGRVRTVAGVDTVVVAVSRVPNDGLYEELKDSFKGVRRVGDALAPRRTAEVIYEGEKVGREL
jgi:hypothetical protein